MIYNSYLFLKGVLWFVNSLCGANRDKVKINLKRFGVIMSHEPGGTSVNNVEHWVQIFRKGKMHRFDYGTVRNL